VKVKEIHLKGKRTYQKSGIFYIFCDPCFA